MGPLRGCDHRVIQIRIYGDHPIARTRANILPDGWLLGLWLVKIGQFLNFYSKSSLSTTNYPRHVFVATG